MQIPLPTLSPAENPTPDPFPSWKSLSRPFSRVQIPLPPPFPGENPSPIPLGLVVTRCHPLSPTVTPPRSRVSAPAGAGKAGKAGPGAGYGSKIPDFGPKQRPGASSGRSRGRRILGKIPNIAWSQSQPGWKRFGIIWDNLELELGLRDSGMGQIFGKTLLGTS